MKQFPQFSQSSIVLDLPQPQAKLMLMALSAFTYSLEHVYSDEQKKSFLAHSQSNYGFQFTTDYTAHPERLQSDLGLLLDSLCNGYLEKKQHFVELVEHELHSHYLTHFDADILNLPQGVGLKVAMYE